MRARDELVQKAVTGMGALVVLAVLAALAFASVVSCRTAGGAAVTTAERVAETAPIPEVRTVEQIFWKQEGYSLSYPDGVVSEVAVFQYDELGTLVLEEHFDAQNDLVTRKTGAMAKTGLYETVTYDGSGVILAKSEQTLRDGLVVREALYDAKGESQSVQENSYDDRGRKTLSTVTVAKGGEVSMAYSYEGDALVSTDVLDPGGNPAKRFIRTYEGGLVVREEEVNAEGKLRAIKLYEYERGFPVRETVKNAGGSTLSVTEFVNDSDGNPVETRYLDRGGNLLEVRMQKWKRFTRTVIAK